MMRPDNSVLSLNVSNSASFNSGVAWGWGIVRASVQVTVSSGSATGIVQLQSSNQKAIGATPNTFIPTFWNNIGSASVVASTSATVNSFLIPSTELCYEYLRVTWTDSSGGTANGLMTINLKSIGV